MEEESITFVKKEEKIIESIQTEEQEEVVLRHTLVDDEQTESVKITNSDKSNLELVPTTDFIKT